MPTIREVDRVRQGTCGSTAVATVAITGNNLDLGTRAEPRFHSGEHPVGQRQAIFQRLLFRRRYRCAAG